MYNEKLRQAVPQILDTHKPELVVYVAGADPYVNDQLGTLVLTKRGLAIRDRIVIEGCHKRGIPVVPVLAGGYAMDTKDTVDIHANTARECLRVLGELRPEPKPAPSNSVDEPTAKDERTDRPTPGEIQK